MDGVVGTLLLAAAILMFGWAMVEYRRPNPSGWTQAEIAAEVIVLFTTALLAFGVGYLVRFLLAFKELHPGVTEVVLIGAEVVLIGVIVFLTWLGLRGLRARQRRLAFSAKEEPGDQSNIVSFAPTSSTGTPDPGQSPPLSFGGGRRARKRKAA
jgi:hypothetical protein